MLGLDFDPARLALAQSFGAEVVNLAAGEDPVLAADDARRGVDAVLITAATHSSEPMHQAALMCRQRGRVVLVGVTGLELSRDDFFRKELTLQVSASPMAPAATTRIMKRKARTTRLASSAGPNNATSKRCWICWLMAGWTSSR